MFSADMAEAFHNALKTLHPIPRMLGKFKPRKSDGTTADAVIQESQYFDMCCLNKKDKPVEIHNNESSILKV